jgi:hypothetical protein
VIRSRAAALLGAALACALAAPPVPAQQQPTTLAPVAPANGAAVGKKPRFVVRIAGSDVENLRFRIELSTDGFESIAYAYDQLEDSNGWAYTALEDGSPGAVYFTRQPMAGGVYLWRVASWDGLSWQEAGDRFRLIIDDVPPADVDGVAMSRDTRSGCVRITWYPVTTDRDGGAERVALYHVYRYASKGPTQPVKPFEAGTTVTTDYEDCDLDALKKPILFYRVVAEDEAGNIPGRKF